jgi:alpha-glucoside transport system substrate-binding protein
MGIWTRQSRRRWFAALSAVAIVGTAAIVILGSFPRGPSQIIGGQVSVLGSWRGEALDTFLAMVSPFEERTGVAVRVVPSPGQEELPRRIRDGRVPDLAVLHGPAEMEMLARSGRLIPLDHILDRSVVRAEYGPGWMDLMTVDGVLRGLFISARVHGLVWYDRPAWRAEHYEIPRTWDEIVALAERAAASGKASWCAAGKSRTSLGAATSDWIEGVLLLTEGAETYDRWVRHRIPWTDQAVRRAWELFGRVASTRPRQAGSLPSSCIFHDAADADEQRARRFRLRRDTYGAFALPPGAGRQAAIVSGELIGMLRDTAQSRALAAHLASGEAQAVVARRGPALSPHRGVGPDVYRTRAARDAAEILAAADVLRYDASELMPPAVSSAFAQAALAYLDASERLDGLLEHLERIADDAY